jgi:predicted membrane channel-forming protein YqfA (hemolysin III family)
MKQLSLWARNHKNPARLIIILSFIGLTITGLATGHLLSSLGVRISTAALFVTVTVYVAGLIVYPVRASKDNKGKTASFYTRQKICDGMLATSTFCMLVFFSNRPDQLFRYTSPLNATLPAPAELPRDSTLKTAKTIAAFSASLRDETGKSLKWKEKKKLLKEQIRAIKKDKAISDGGKVGLIILSVLAAIGLLYLVAALACNLSCSGAEGAATLVMIGGAGLIVFLLVLVIRSITKKNKTMKTTGTSPDDPAKLP